MKTFYDVLNLSEKASSEEINEAYNQLKNKYSMYLNDSENFEKAKEKIKKLNIAYEILSNSQSRASYDKDLENMRQNELMNNLQQNTNSYNEEVKKQEEKKQLELEQERKRQKIRFVEQEIEKQIEEQKKQIEEQKAREELKEQFRKEINDAQEKAYNDAYKKYLKKMGIEKYGGIKKFFRTIIASIIVLGIVFLVFQIPAVKNAILNSEIVQFFSK